MTDLKKNKFWQRGQKFLGVSNPIIAGAMTWISNSRLVAAMAEAGGLGALAGGNMPVNYLEEEIQTLTKGGFPFALNLITLAPNYHAHLDLAGKYQVPFIIFAGSFPRKSEVQQAKQTAAKVLCFASTESIAQRMMEYGADALILEGSEAGGHIGHVSTIVLIQQVLFKFPHIPIFIAGGIATGRMIAHLFLMGAAGVQMGTIFAMSEESPAHPRFKERFKKARAREAFATPQYDSTLPVVSVRAIRNDGTQDFNHLQLDLVNKLKSDKISRIKAQYEVENFWNGALRRAVQDGDIDHGSLMAGQSVGLVSEIKTIGQIMDQLVQEANKEYQRIEESLFVEK